MAQWGSRAAARHSVLAMGVLALTMALLAAPSVPIGALEHDDEPVEPTWAPADQAPIRPGTEVRSGGQCTSNFVFYDHDDVYLGFAAHCATEDASGTNGCLARPSPPGTEVTISGATRPGVLAYSSWHTMRERLERDAATCGHNDFALIRLHPDDRARVNPSLQAFGGPAGRADDAPAARSKVYSYGSSSLRQGLSPLSPKEGYVLGTTADGWNHQVYTATPGIFGDSGSAALDDGGRAFGVVVTVQFAPYAASNGVTDLARAMGYAQQHWNEHLRLADGTEQFRGGLLP